MPASKATDDDIKLGEVFQARSYDLSTMSIIKVADHQWALIDPLLGPDTAVAAWETFKSKVDSEAKICAIMITHSHVDHYKGVSGLIEHEKLQKITSNEFSFTDGQDSKITIENGHVIVIAPVGFYDESISESLYLGNCMGRRAQYMYGSALPRGIFGAVGSGLGKTVSNQVGDIPVPSLEIPFSNSDVQEITINGKEFVFQNVPGTEAPAEMHIGFKANDSEYVLKMEDILENILVDLKEDELLLANHIINDFPNLKTPKRSKNNTRIDNSKNLQLYESRQVCLNTVISEFKEKTWVTLSGSLGVGKHVVAQKASIVFNNNDYLIININALSNNLVSNFCGEITKGLFGTNIDDLVLL